MNSCIKKAREGNPLATEALFSALKTRISRMAAYFSHCTGEDSDDLRQEAWLGLLEALPQLDMAIGSPEQHLILRARWRLLDAAKRARVRRCLRLEDCPEDRTPRCPSESALSAMCVCEFGEGLSTSQKAVLECLMNGLTWREAGDKLGCTSANIAYHVRQIRKRYREWVEETDY